MWEEYNTPQLLDEKICDANIIQMDVILTSYYLRDAQGNEMLIYSNMLTH
jgi:hypothetical protein